MSLALLTAAVCLVQDGPESSGKSTVAHMLSKLAGEELLVMSMNSAMDTTDLLGGFEQVSRLHMVYLAHRYSIVGVGDTVEPDLIATV